jgi:histidine triad (HIT) family protein
VIPKQRKAFLHELSDDSAAAIGRVLPRIARAILRATGATAYNVLQNNGAAAHQAVFHVHFHIIPRVGDTGLGLGWHPSSLGGDAGTELSARIREELEHTSA